MRRQGHAAQEFGEHFSTIRILRRVGQRLAAAASRHHHWLATPEENAAVGMTMP